MARVFKAELQYLNLLLPGLLQKILSVHILLNKDKCSQQVSQVLLYTLHSFVSSLIPHFYLIIIVLNQHKQLSTILLKTPTLQDQL